MTAAARIVLLVTSPRVAAGVLSADAWAALQAGPVFVGPDAAALPALRAAGVEVRVTTGDRPAAAFAQEICAAAADHGSATWWVAPSGDDPVAQALRDTGTQLETVHGNWDLPGARLLDVVATMDRLRSPGGCPWDAAQDHDSLAPYLLEEAYEAFQAIEDGDLAALRAELGDVLLQIAFHARLAEELPGDQRWSIDDVATGLVDKLVRRHPHVFDGVAVADADEVNRNWEQIKAAERGEGSALADVPLAAAALTLTATLQRKAERSGEADVAAAALDEATAAYLDAPSASSAGELLWAAVAAMRDADIDAESALRARAKTFRDRVLDTPNE